MMGYDSTKYAEKLIFSSAQVKNQTTSKLFFYSILKENKGF